MNEIKWINDSDYVLQNNIILLGNIKYLKIQCKISWGREIINAMREIIIKRKTHGGKHGVRQGRRETIASKMLEDKNNISGNGSQLRALRNSYCHRKSQMIRRFNSRTRAFHKKWSHGRFFSQWK